MKIFLSNVPKLILAREFKKDSVKSWIYFGRNDSVFKKLERIFNTKAQRIDYGKKLYETTKAKRKPFILWIDQMAAPLLDRKEWLFSVPAVKNTYISNLFLYTCYVSVWEDLVRERRQAEIIFVDSPALAALFKERFADSVEIAPINQWLNLAFYLRVWVKSILRLGKYVIEFGRRFVAAKIVLKDRSRKLLGNKGNIVLIRNFMTGEFSDTAHDVLERHYFPGLYDYLEKKHYTPVFLPVITTASSYRRLYRKVSQSKKNIIFPEEFLKLRDYLYTFLVPLRAARLKISSPVDGPYQLGPLLREEYYANLTEHGFLYATLLSCLGKRFKEYNLTPLGIINWMENQALEKGLIKGFKENFSDVQVIGSQPFFIQENYLAPVSSSQEKQSGLLPEKIVVLGPAGKKCATEFIEDAPVDYSPSFRYASAIGEPSVNNQANSLLVLFTIDFKDAIGMMNMLLKIEPHLKSFGRIMIKLHPTAAFDEQQLVKALGQNLSSQYQFVHGKVEEYLPQTAVGFCAGASSTAAQLVMRGIQVITLGEAYALTLECLSCKKDPDIWQVCFSAQEVVEAINHFRMVRKERPQDLIRKAQEFTNLFIAPPSEKYWENYLVEPAMFKSQ